MTKIVAWIVVIFLVLFALRMINLRNARARRDAARKSAGAKPAEPMVRCARCGIYLPRAEAKEERGGYVCASGGCSDG